MITVGYWNKCQILDFARFETIKQARAWAQEKIRNPVLCRNLKTHSVWVSEFSDPDTFVVTSSDCHVALLFDSSKPEIPLRNSAYDGPMGIFTDLEDCFGEETK